MFICVKVEEGLSCWQVPGLELSCAHSTMITQGCEFSTSGGHFWPAKCHQSKHLGF